jgi:HlyD family secretion protein
MRRLAPILVGILVVVLFLGTVGFLYVQSREAPVVYDTVQPTIKDIVQKTVATGAIIPRNEVAIKSRVSGIIDTLEVEPGDIVKSGDLIAKVRIVPDTVSLNRAESDVDAAKIKLADAKATWERAQELAENRAVSDTELRTATVAHDLASEEYAAAVSNLELVREGASRRSGVASTDVIATVPGMILDLPVKAGESVIPSNTFNEGTTIAAVADMKDLIFEGEVDESEVGKVKEGMPLEITVGALDDQTFQGTLEYIAPKGELKEGAIQFKIRAAITVPEGTLIRAASSANADIVLGRRDKVLSLPEAVVKFEVGADDKEKASVEVETGPDRYEPREIVVGLSDGIDIEVVSGIDESTKVKAGEVVAGEEGASSIRTGAAGPRGGSRRRR